MAASERLETVVRAHRHMIGIDGGIIYILRPPPDVGNIPRKRKRREQRPEIRLLPMEIQQGDAPGMFQILRQRRLERRSGKNRLLEFPAERMRTRGHVEIRLPDDRNRVGQDLREAIVHAREQFPPFKRVHDHARKPFAVVDRAVVQIPEIADGDVAETFFARERTTGASVRKQEVAAKRRAVRVFRVFGKIGGIFRTVFVANRKHARSAPPSRALVSEIDARYLPPSRRELFHALPPQFRVRCAVANHIDANKIAQATVALSHCGDLAGQAGEKHRPSGCDRFVKIRKELSVQHAANIFRAAHGRDALDGLGQCVFDGPIVCIDRAGHAPATRKDVFRQNREYSAGCRFRPDFVGCHYGIAGAFVFRPRQTARLVRLQPFRQNRPCLGRHFVRQKRFQTFNNTLGAVLYARISQTVDCRGLPLAVVDERRVDIHAMGVLDKKTIGEKDIFGISHARLESDFPDQRGLRQYMLHTVEIAMQPVWIGRAGHAVHRAGNGLYAAGKRRLLGDALDRRIGEIRVVGLAGVQHDLHRLRMKQIVRIEEPDVVPRHMLHPEVSRTGNAAVLLGCHDLHARVFSGVFGEYLRRRVCRAVVAADYVDVSVRLQQNAVERSGQESPGVVDGDYKRHLWPGADLRPQSATLIDEPAAVRQQSRHFRIQLFLADEQRVTLFVQWPDRRQLYLAAHFLFVLFYFQPDEQCDSFIIVHVGLYVIECLQ